VKRKQVTHLRNMPSSLIKGFAPPNGIRPNPSLPRIQIVTHLFSIFNQIVGLVVALKKSLDMLWIVSSTPRAVVVAVMTLHHDLVSHFKWCIVSCEYFASQQL
jgi:hypothetical protein